MKTTISSKDDRVEIIAAVPVAKHDVVPEVDLALCNGCGGCIDVAPEIFRWNDAFGFLEVVDLDCYDVDLVEEAIRNCPKNAIKITGSQE